MNVDDPMGIHETAKAIAALLDMYGRTTAHVIGGSDNPSRHYWPTAMLH